MATIFPQDTILAEADGRTDKNGEDKGLKALVLSSGGVDSTTCLALALDRFGKGNVASVSFYYGQKHRKELECARKLALHYGIPHQEIDFSHTGIFDRSDCSLLQGSGRPIAHGSYADQIRDGGGIVSTYVPFRNGLFLSAAAALGMSLWGEEPCELYLGAHADDAAGNAYADCTPEFTRAMGEAISAGTYGRVRLSVPFVGHSKAEVVACGLKLHVPYEMTWSCYEGGEKPCGVCGTCIDRKKAFEANGVEDPLLKNDN